MARPESFKIASTGLTELNPELAPERALVDIVFVHGLGGDPRDTWTYRGSKKDPVSERPGTEQAQAPDQYVHRNANGTLITKPLDKQARNTNEEQDATMNEIQAANLNDEQAENVNEAQFADSAEGQHENLSEGQTSQHIAKKQEDQETSRQNFLLERIKSSFKSSSPSQRIMGKGKEKATPPGAGTRTSVATEQSNGKVKNVFFWPQNLPEECACARVMTFGYDSDVSKFFGGAANKNTFYDHAGDLLGALTRKRKSAQDRPIIFVAHSLGGLVVKQMLFDAERSKAFPDRQKVYQSTKALFFLGTPHKGSNWAVWGEIARELASVIFDTNPSLIKHLKVNGEALMQLEKNFEPLIYLRTFWIFTFAEAKGYKPLPLLNSKIVNQNYSKVGDPGRERAFTINANHIAMCRYWGRKDPGYETVAGELSGFVHLLIAQTEAEAREKGERKAAERQAGILDLLVYDGIDARENVIKHAFVETFDWMLPTESFSQGIEDNQAAIPQRKAMLDFAHWITRSDHSLFWISGKAGSGKSTLMKKLAKASSLEQLLQSHFAGKECLVASFWFSEQTKVTLLKTREGMLRSLLYQLLNRQRELIKSIFPDLWNDRLLQGEYLWPLHVLQDALSAFIRLKASSRILLLVDGLDEYDFYEYKDYHGSDESGSDAQDVDRAARKSKAHSEIGNFFKDLAKYRNARICVASRPKKFDSIFRGQPGFRLEDLTSTDIRIYVKGRMEAEACTVSWSPTEPEEWHELQDQIVKNAAGVFLWVRLIVDILIDGSSDFDTIDELRKKLESLPTELGGPKGLYVKMLRDIKMEHRSQGALFIDMVRTANTPLSLLSMYFAEATGIPKIINASLQRYPFHKTQQIYQLMEGRLRSRCAGLLECKPITNRGFQSPEIGRDRTLLKNVDEFVINSENEIHFIHATFDEFLRQPYAEDLLHTMRSSSLPDLSVDLAIVQGSVASMKFLSAPVRLVWLWIHNVLHHASNAVKRASKAREIELLFDEMDRVLKWLFEDITHPARGLDGIFTVTHWYMTEFQEQGGRDHTEIPDVACIAVMSDLTSYVESKFRLKKISNAKDSRRSLLEYAVCPPINLPLWEYDNNFDGIGMLQASPEMVTLLLENGADPNEARDQRPYSTSSHNPGSDTVWKHLLMEDCQQDKIHRRVILSEHAILLTERQSKERWCNIALILLRYGADAKSQVTGEYYRVQQKPHSTLYYAHARLCPEQDLQNKLCQALEAAGATWLPDEKEHQCNKCRVIETEDSL